MEILPVDRQPKFARGTSHRQLLIIRLVHSAQVQVKGIKYWQDQARGFVPCIGKYRLEENYKKLKVYIVTYRRAIVIREIKILSA